MFYQSSETVREGPNRGIKRKASSDSRSPRKMIRMSEGEYPTTSEDRMGPVQRKVMEDEEGKSLVDIFKCGEKLASCSTNTERVEVKKGGLKRKADKDEEGPDRKKKRVTKKETKLRLAALKAEFEAKYEQLNLLGLGGCGSVFAGVRKADQLPVAIKYIGKKAVVCKEKDDNGKLVSAEVAIMLKLAALSGGKVGTSASVSLLDWYNMGKELILVLERPVPSMDLFDYTYKTQHPISEEEAKIIMKQLVGAAIKLHNNHIFHRDIKLENILIETGSDVPRPRLIDFGLSCFFKKQSCFRNFFGTPDHVPPEVLSHCHYKPGPTTVWQMGVVLFEMFQETRRFNTSLFLRNIVKINDSLSKECQDFLHECLAEDPKNRPTLKQLKRHRWLR